MSDIYKYDAYEIASMIKNKKITAAEVALDAIERINLVNPIINAIVDFDPEKVLDNARHIDAARAKGLPLGPLAGVPVTIKVNIDQKGYATTNGTRLQQNLIAADNNPVVDNLLSSGAVLLGRTNTPAFSYRWFTDNLLHGATLNPHNATLTPGGSSGGAGAAVSSGLGYLAHGTDIAGSVRYPAYACGVHGIRPSFGRVAAYNASSAERDIGGQLMAVSGLLGRSMRDLQLGLDVLSRGDARDPWWRPSGGVEQPFVKRAALCTHPGGIEVCEVIRQKLLDTAMLLKDAGWAVEEVDDIPDFRLAAELNVGLWINDGYDEKRHNALKEDDKAAIHVLKNMKEIFNSQHEKNLSEILTLRATLIRKWQCFQQHYPLIISPVSSDLPFSNHLDVASDADFKRVWEAQLPQMSVPFIGVPGLSVFTGLHNNTPTGVQLIAPHFREAICFEAGLTIENAFGKPEVITPAINNNVN